MRLTSIIPCSFRGVFEQYQSIDTKPTREATSILSSIPSATIKTKGETSFTDEFVVGTEKGTRTFHSIVNRANNSVEIQEVIIIRDDD